MSTPGAHLHCRVPRGRSPCRAATDRQSAPDLQLLQVGSLLAVHDGRKSACPCHRYTLRPGQTTHGGGRQDKEAQKNGWLAQRNMHYSLQGTCTGCVCWARLAWTDVIGRLTGRLEDGGRPGWVFVSVGPGEDAQQTAASWLGGGYLQYFAASICARKQPPTRRHIQCTFCIPPIVYPQSRSAMPLSAVTLASA